MNFFLAPILFIWGLIAQFLPNKQIVTRPILHKCVTKKIPDLIESEALLLGRQASLSLGKCALFSVVLDLVVLLSSKLSLINAKATPKSQAMSSMPVWKQRKWPSTTRVKWFTTKKVSGLR